MSGTNRQFEFVNYKGGTNKALQKVRKHVMKDYFWRQNNPSGNNAPIEQEKDFAVKEFTWMQPGTIDTSKPRKRSSSVFPAALVNADLERSIASSLCITSSKGGALNLDAFVTPIPHGLDAHSLDPFDSLPIKNDPDVGNMLQWYFTTSKLRTTTIIPWVRELNGAWQRIMWDLAQSDKGALHALLSIAEVKMFALTGDINPVRYCNNVEKVIDAIKDYLSDASTTNRRQVLTMLISTQVSRAVGEEDYETAKMHMQALRRLALRYPPWAKSHSPQKRQLDREGILFIYTATNDTRLASTTCERPMIKLKPARLLELAPTNLLNEARQRTIITLKFLPSGVGSSKPYATISELHQLSLALNPQYAQDLYLTAFFNIFAQTLYRHCEMAAESRRRALLNSGKFMLPTDALSFTMLLFARSCLPTDLPSTRRLTIDGNIEVILIGHVFHGLSPAADLLTSWTDDGESLESLVWVLFLGAFTGLKFDLDNLPWFLDSLIKTLNRLEIYHLEQFEQCLKIFPWTAPYFGQNFTVLGQTLGLDTISVV